MSRVKMQDMLVAGMHFGHQTHRWNPKMRPFIFGARNKIHIINLDLTLPLIDKACQKVTETVANGGRVLFVGTKKQSQDIIREEAERCKQFYINNRWLGGTLTNFQTIKNSIERLKKIEAMQEDGSINQYKKKEAMMMEKQAEKLHKNLGGIKDMKSHPDLIFIVDPKREDIAVDEARRLGIPVVAITDTNCDPDLIEHIIPGNDDAIKSIKLVCAAIADAAIEGLEAQPQTGEETEAPAAPVAPEAPEVAPAVPEAPEAPEAPAAE